MLLKPRKITRITTTCHKKVNGTWTYQGKIYYQHNNIKSVKSVTADSMNRLLSILKNEAQNIFNA